MYNKSNLALIIDECYKYKQNRLRVTNFNNNELIVPTKKALILRENIMASGMEVCDMVKVTELAKLNVFGGA